MTIKVKYIFNTQAIEVKSPKGYENWRIYEMNRQRYAYYDHISNGGEVSEWTDEKVEASKGNY